MKDNKVRLKLIAQRKRSKGVSASAGMDFKIFGIKIIDKQVKKFLDMNLANMGISSTAGNLFVLDYIFDLRNEEAAQAYDSILASSLKFKNLEVLNPFLSNRELTAQIIGDMTAAEAVFAVDREKKPEDRRVDRIFKGLNDYSQKASNFKVGINLLRFQKERVFTSNYLTYYDAKDRTTEFFYPAYSVQKKRKFLFGVYESSEVNSAFGLFECDEQRNIVRFSDYGFNYELKDNVLRSSEQSAFKKDIMRLISPDLYSEIQWGDWQKEERRSNARLSHQIVFRPQALEVFSGLSEDDIYTKLAVYIAALPELPDPHSNDDSYSSGPEGCYVSRRWSEAKKAAARSACAKNYDGYWRSMTRMVEELRESFTNKDMSKYEETISGFMDLRKNWAFRKIGTGLMISLIPPEKRTKAIQVNVRWTAKKTGTLEFSYGDAAKSNFYNDLQYILSILNNRSIDLRLNERELEFRDREIETAD
jgi:uncharacterized protein YbdZ (MbtH family)